MIIHVRKTINRYAMLQPGDRVGIAVSGGPDSVALLNVLQAIAEEYDLTLIIIHINHGLRGHESDRDEQFVKKLGREKNIPVISTFVDIPSIFEENKRGSLENVCREERYRFFEKIHKEHNLQKIALGHTLDDQTETVIMNFLRGSGLKGLKGILPVRDKIYIRPLIETSRKTVMQYLAKEHIASVTDSTNNDTVYLRNKIRKGLIPNIKKEYNPRLNENINTLVDIFREEDNFISSEVKKILARWKIQSPANEQRIMISQLMLLHPALRRRIIKAVLEKWLHRSKQLNFSHIMSVMNLIENDVPSGYVDISAHVCVQREYDVLKIMKRVDHDGEKSFCYQLEIPGRLTIKELGREMVLDYVDYQKVDFRCKNAVFMNFDAVECPLMVRNMLPGDKIHPFGMKGTKKLKDLFIDEKIPRKQRSKIPLLVDQKSVLWVPGIRMSEKVRIVDMTEKVVKAEII